MSQARRLRLGLLGAGRRAQVHVSALAGLADLYDFVAVCDASENAASAVARGLGIKGYSDVDEFFSRDSLDVVDIVTPAESHHLMAKAAAEHGVHMLVETPLAPTRAMMDLIAEAADKAGVRVEVAENFRRQPEERLNRSALDAGLIGKIVRVSSYYEPIGQAGCYHTMSMLRYYAGSEVQELQAFSRRSSVERSAMYGRPFDSEHWTQALLFFSDGTLGNCTYLSSWSSPLRQGHPRFLTAEGTAGLIVSGRNSIKTLQRIENVAPKAYPLRVEARRDGDREIPTRFYYETDPVVDYKNPFVDRPLNYADNWGAADVIAVADALAGIHKAVTNDVAPEYGIVDARRDQELSIAINESARLDGRRIRLPLREETAWEHEQHERFRSRWGADPLKDADTLIHHNFSARK